MRDHGTQPLKGPTTVRAALAARERIPGLPVLILSQHVEQVYASELLADGAGGVGYLLKERVADVADFVDAVRRVAGRGTVLDPEVVAQILARRRASARVLAVLAYLRADS